MMQHIWLLIIKHQSCHHIEITICKANQVTGFYMMATLPFNELIKHCLCWIKIEKVLNELNGF